MLGCKLAESLIEANHKLQAGIGEAIDIGRYQREQYGVKDEQLILYGQSVGSGPTVDLASQLPNLRGVVLHSPILSGMRVLYPVKRTYWFDIYKNIDKIGMVNCPVLVIHGTADEVVDCSHGNSFGSFARRGKTKTATNGSKKTTVELENQNKPSESGTSDTFELGADLPEISRNSLDSRLEKSKKPNKPEKSRMSTDRVDRFRRSKGLVCRIPCCLSNPDFHASCNISQYVCGSIAAGFPFWGKDRPDICGIPGLELKCKNDTPTIEIKDGMYRVLEIDEQSQTLRIARKDYMDGLCQPQLKNTTLDPQLFEYVPGYKNLTIIYGCPIPGVPALFNYLISGSASPKGSGGISNKVLLGVGKLCSSKDTL
ncbi:hypothetical protein GH714_043710 [Hevea brasiliensis]|uniref:Wall-associated receptor kinase galacturonan-binding domain-containing protein n=1 Tax=Hevea brasiliensis TaxID=3981 RepID=A0A6A6K309_HEVBR|nr:hypothetical protein GH714_043710 [Hevea brasiliensis]